MTRIRVLPDRVANQIAAGEVIERPAAVIKELVENALDAGATRIEVEFSHGGRSLMRVEDNGSGMTGAEAELALQRHATSKILEADDLNRLATFGFRGEALPSIASVSRFLIQTRESSSEVGTEIFVNGGKYVHVRECGRPVGTRIEVSQLFNSVPARRKFLKSDTTEAAHIIHSVRLYALAFPQVSFTLIEDGRVIFKSPQCHSLLERVAGIFGKQLADGLMPLDVEEQGMRLTGLIGLPGQGRATRHEMITFINQRPVDSRTLNYALIESYHESLPKGRYPVAFVFFDLPPAEVDVNVHPAKREVRFRSEPAVRSFVIRNVLGRLRDSSPLPSGDFLGSQPSSGPASYANLPSSDPAIATAAGSVSRDFGRSSTNFASPSGSLAPIKGLVLTPAPLLTPGNRSWPAPVVTLRPTDPGSIGQPASTPAPVAELGRAWRFLGLAHRATATFETPSGIAFIDRRAAEERIWYERIQAQFTNGQLHSQRLLLPVPIELDAISSALLLDAQRFLNTHGFEIVEFGRNFFRVEAVPDWMQPSAAEEFVRDLVSLLREGQLHVKDLGVARDELARFAAGRAYRSSENVSDHELQTLVTQLFRCRMPHTTPSGRPTYFEMSLGEISRKFGR